MLEQLNKSLDRILNVPNRNRPEAQEYLRLLSETEREFIDDLTTFIRALNPESMRSVCMIGGSLSRQYDRKRFGLKRRIPHDIDIAFTATGQPGSSSETAKLYYSAIEAFLYQAGLEFERVNTYRQMMMFRIQSVQFVTAATKDMRSFDLVFLNYFDIDSTESMQEAAARTHTPLVVLFDDRDPEYIQQKLKERLEAEQYERAYWNA